MTWRCWFRHATHYRILGEEWQIACTRCEAVLDRGPVVRPEIANRAAAAEHQAASERQRFLREREQRAQQMGTVRPFKRVR
jgi:hypothetical protein